MDAQQHYIDDIIVQLRKYKRLAEKAVGQIDDEQFFETADHEASNSIAIIMKHMAGNMRSRWTDFLKSDGEKPDRNRDQEFVIEEGSSRDSILKTWEKGWEYVFGAISSLQPDDLTRTVTIRGEEHTALEAINRQYAHYAYHVGQIVMLAKDFAGDGWQFLSIPLGKSKEFDVSKHGELYEVEPGE